MIRSTEKKLAAWVEAGALSQEAASKILAYEATQKGTSWALFGVVGIGVVTILTGIVSLVAANWGSISPDVKLALYLVLQFGLGALYLKFQSGSRWVREGALLAFALLFFAGIGLTAQIFQLHGDGWQAILFWCALTAAAMWVAETAWLAHLWTVFLLIAGLIWGTSDRTRDFGHLQFRPIVALSVPIALATLGLWAQGLRKYSEPFRKATVVWGFGTIVIGGSLLANTFWIERHIGLKLNLPYLLVPWFILLLGVIGSFARSGSSPFSLRATTAALLLVTGAFITAPLFYIHVEWERELRNVIGALAFLSIWALAAASAAQAGYRRLYDVATAVIALRFVVIYFEVFGNLSYTGFGLILSGAVILGFAYVWGKYRTKVETLLGGGR